MRQLAQLLKKDAPQCIVIIKSIYYRDVLCCVKLVVYVIMVIFISPQSGSKKSYIQQNTIQ